MGDRGNIVIRQQSPSGERTHIYFYTHWEGTHIPKTLQKALDRGKSRWDDPAYLSRIIFCELIKEDVMSTTGYGISLSPPDNEHKYLVVDMDNLEVTLHHADDDLLTSDPIGRWSIETYCKLHISEVEGWHEIGDSASHTIQKRAAH